MSYSWSLPASMSEADVNQELSKNGISACGDDSLGDRCDGPLLRDDWGVVRGEGIKDSQNSSATDFRLVEEGVLAGDCMTNV